jgi:hypothetical protein
MYILKIRNVGVIKIEDNYLGGEILKQWQMGNLPNVVTIGDQTFLSRLLESVNKAPKNTRGIHELGDDELRPLARSFGAKMKRAREIPEVDYSRNDVFPYHSNFLLHIFAVAGVISNNNLEKVWRISASNTTSGDISIVGFLEVDKQLNAFLELRDRYPATYEKYARLLYKKLGGEVLISDLNF